MTITLTVEATLENIEKLKAFCINLEHQEAENLTSGVSTDDSELKDSEPFETKKEDSPPFNVDEQPISKTDVRAVALKISKAGGANKLREIFAKFGATNLKGIPEDKYPELMRELVAVDA